MGCRPRLRNHGVGWVGWVERLRNGGVPRDPADPQQTVSLFFASIKAGGDPLLLL